MTPKEIFAFNLNRLMEKYGKQQSDIVSYMNTTASTVSDWCNAKKYPRVDKMQKLADYFGVLKSDLTEEYHQELTPVEINPTHKIPVLGRISAGLPLYAEEHINSYIYTELNGGAEYFGLRVQGDSMTAARKKQVNHGTIYEVKASGDKRLVSMENYEGTAKVTVELADINKLNKAGKKLLILSLVKANEQALHNGELTRDYISFPLQDLIHYGLYARLNGARKGFEIGTDALTSIKVKGTIRKSKKSTATIKALEVPFTGAKIENNQCYIYLNTRIDWNFLTQYFTKIPKYYFKLSNRASDLLYYIFYLARQHTREIASRGYFTISFRAIHSLLKLPSETGTQRHEQLIRRLIEDAVGEIETEHKQMYGNKEFSLELVYDEKTGISEYLDNGYLKVSLKGAFAEPFITQSQTKQKKIQQAEQKKARIEEKAIAMKMAKEDKTEI